jgi:tRNA pseudouridine55 synthase
MTGIKQIGHAGTLDPSATGVLPMALGSACRLLRFLTTDKVYLAEVLLGRRTTTDDLTGDILAELPVGENIDQALQEALLSFVGPQQQMPPAYSAIHHGGKRLYELARAGVTPSDVQPREIKIEAIDLLAMQLPTIQVRIKCSGGTYIRSIARDLGEKLGTGACLQSLIREKSGPFLLDQALSLESLAELAISGRLGEALISPEKVLGLDIVDVDEDKARTLALGQYLPINLLSSSNQNEFTDGKLCLVMCQRSLIALCGVTEDKRLHPEVVISHAKSLV